MAADASDHDLRCPYCREREPSVWDDVLFHYAHPDLAAGKLKFCHEPWRERCRRCSADVVVGGKFCEQHAAEAGS